MDNMHTDAGHRGFTQTQQEFLFLLPLRLVMQCREGSAFLDEFT